MNKDLVKVDDSKSERQLEFFKSISTSSDSYSSYLEKLDEKKLRRVRNSVSAIKSGVHASAPLMCLGPEKCPFLKRCPIPEIANWRP